MKDYYYILGITENATKQEIRTAYRKLSKKFHPDMNDGDSFFESRFKEINEAYEVLSDEIQRNIYNSSRKKGTNYSYEEKIYDPKIKLFTVSSSKLFVGDEIEIKWETEYCTKVEINLFGEVKFEGSKNIKFKEPKQNLKLKIIAINIQNKTISKEIYIDVLEKATSEDVIKAEPNETEIEDLKIKWQYVLIIPIIILLSYALWRFIYPQENSASPIVPISPVSPLEYDTTLFRLNGVDPTVNMIVDESIVVLDSSFIINSKIPLWKYLTVKKGSGSLGFKPVTSMVETEIGKQYLFILYYTGGAHCCYDISIYKFNITQGAYIYFGGTNFDVGESGDIDEIDYPIYFDRVQSYFHSSYAYGGIVDCSESNYKEILLIENDSVIIKYEGDSKLLENCFIKYLNDNRIPELEGEIDDGQREIILNTLENIYNLTRDIDIIFSLYNNNLPDLSDRNTLWFEILEQISDKEKNLKAEFRSKIINQKLELDRYKELSGSILNEYNKPKIKELIEDILNRQNKIFTDDDIESLLITYKNNVALLFDDYKRLNKAKYELDEIIIDKIRYDIPLNSEEKELIKKIESNDLNIIIPSGYYIPTQNDVEFGNGWYDIRKYLGIKEPYHLMDDFNGDGEDDHAYLMYKDTKNNYDLFCYLKTGNEYKTIKLPFTSSRNGVHPITDFYLLKWHPDENACLYDGIGKEIKRINLSNTAIGVSGFESGDPFVFVFNKNTEKFDFYTKCSN